MDVTFLPFLPNNETSLAKIPPSTAGACLSPDGQCAACWQAQSCSLSLLEADSKQEAAVTLSPAAGKSANGKAGPAKPADVLTLGAWNADSSTLAVATAGGGIYLVSRRGGQVLQDWPSKLSKWARDGLMGLAFTDHGALLVLNGIGDVWMLPLEQGAPSQPQKPLLSVKECHTRITGMAFLPQPSLLVVVGEQSGLEEAPTADQLDAKLTLSVHNLGDPAHAELTVLKGDGRVRSVSGRKHQASRKWAVATSEECIAVTVEGGPLLLYDFESSSSGEKGLRRLEPPDIKEAQQNIDKLRSNGCLVRWNVNMLALLTLDGQLKLVDMSTLVVTDAPDELQSLHGIALGSGAGPDSSTSGSLLMLGCLDEGAPLSSYPRQEQSGSLLDILSPTATPRDTRQPGAAGRTRWRPALLTGVDDEARLQQHLERQQWAAARDVAASMGKSLDTILKAQWEASEVTEESIGACLQPAEDRFWAAEQALTRLAPTAQTQEALLHFMLEESALQMQTLHGAEDEQSQATAFWWLQQRIRTLRQLERLHTHQALSNGSFDATGYSALANCEAFDAAVVLATSAQTKQLQILLHRHAYVVSSRILHVLDCLPETLGSQQVADLLVQFSPDQWPELLREADWAEMLDYCVLLAQQNCEDLCYATEPMVQAYAGWCPPSRFQVAEWLVERAKAVEQTTGQLGLCARLLKQALAQAEAAEGAFAPQAQQLTDSIRELQAAMRADPQHWHMSLAEFSSQDPLKKLQDSIRSAQGAGIGDASIAGIITQHLLEVPHKERLDQLHKLLRNRHSQNLSCCLHVLQQELKEPKAFETRTEAAAAVVKTVDVLEAGTEWGHLDALLEEAAHCQDVEESTLLRVQQVKLRVAAAKLLHQTAVEAAPQELVVEDADAARALLERVLRQHTSGKPAESQWGEMWQRLGELHRCLWTGCLPLEAVHAAAVKAMLCCGHFTAARKQLAGSREGSHDAVAQAVIAAARQYFQAAQSADSEEMALAQLCLATLPKHAAVQHELASIRALQELQYFGVHLTPAEYQQVGNRMALVQAALAADASAHANMGAIRGLAKLLDITGQDQELCFHAAHAALQHGDGPSARRLCLPLVERNYRPAWCLAAAVARETGDSASDMRLQQRLLHFALLHCPKSQICGLLSHLEALHSHTGGRSLHHSMEDLEQLLGETIHSASSPGAAYADSCQEVSLAGPYLTAVACCLHLLRSGGCAALEASLARWQHNPAGHRCALLAGVTAGALQVLLGHSSASSLQQGTEVIQQLLAQPPQALAQRCLQLKPEALNSEQRAGQQACRQLLELVRSSANVQVVQAVLPGVDLAQFTGTGDAAVSYRLQALLKRCQSVAGKQGPGPEAEAFLQQTLQLAEQYGVPTWELLTAFVTAMLVQWQHEAAAVNALVKRQLLVLVQCPRQLLRCLLGEVWPELQGQRAAHVGTVLQLVQAALAQAGKQAQSGVGGDATGSEAGQQSEGAHAGLHSPSLSRQAALAAEALMGSGQAALPVLSDLIAFCRGCADAAPGLDVKPFLEAVLLLHQGAVLPHMPDVAAAEAATGAKAGPLQNGSPASDSSTLDMGWAGQEQQVLHAAAPSCNSRHQGNGTAAQEQQQGARLHSLMQMAAKELAVHAGLDNADQLSSLLEALPTGPAEMMLHASKTSTAAWDNLLSRSAVHAAAVCSAAAEAADWPQHEFEEQWNVARRLLLQLKPKHAAATLAHLLLKGQHPLQQQVEAQAETDSSGWGRGGAGVEDDGGLPPAPLLSWSVQLRIARDGSKVLHKLGAGLGEGGVDAADRDQDIQAHKGVQAQMKLLARALKLAQECAAACELGDEQQQALQTWIEGLRFPLGSQQRAGFADVLQTLAAGACPAAVLLHAAISADELLCEGSSSSPKAPSQAAAAVGQALTSALGSVLEQLAHPDTARSPNHSQAQWNSLLAARNILSSLSNSEDQHPSHLSPPLFTLLDQYVAEWRDSAWTQLQQHAAAASDSGALHPSTLQLLELMAALQGGSSQAGAPPQHNPATSEQGRAQSLLLGVAGAQPLLWEGWQPSKAAGQAGADQRLLLLKVRTAALVQPLWQGLQVETNQLDSLQGAQQLCMQLLGQAHSGEQLEALLRLLGPVWDYGSQWEAARLQKNSTNLNELHSCWAGVFQQLLACGRAEPVLAALDAAAAREDRGLQLLMTQQEALHLTEQAQNHGLQGTALCLAHLSQHASVWHRALQHAVSRREPWPLSVALDLMACLLAAGSLAVCAASKPMFDSLMAALLSKPAPPLLTAEHGAEQPRAWLLPSAAAALTVAGLQGDAAAIAAHHSKVHSALSFFGAESSHLKPYLAGSARAASRSTPAFSAPLSVPHTVMQLCLRLSADCKKAIDALSATT